MFDSYKIDRFTRSLANRSLSLLPFLVHYSKRDGGINHIFEMVANFWLRNKGRLFDFHDVDGDGNCFYGACALHPLIPGDNDLEVRRNLMDCIESKLNRGDTQIESIFNKLGYTVSLREWITQNRQIATWAGYTAAVLMSYCYNINIDQET